MLNDRILPTARSVALFLHDLSRSMAAFADMCGRLAQSIDSLVDTAEPFIKAPPEN
jgi:hypothetical protein